MQLHTVTANSATSWLIGFSLIIVNECQIQYNLFSHHFLFSVGLSMSLEVLWYIFYDAAERYNSYFIAALYPELRDYRVGKRKNLMLSFMFLYNKILGSVSLNFIFSNLISFEKNRNRNLRKKYIIDFIQNIWSLGWIQKVYQ